MNQEEFFNACKNHDWTYSYSDDGRVYRQGEAADSKLRDQAKTDPVLENIHTAWYNYVWSGPHRNTERLPRPKLEDF
jgi:hypothetical protein